MITKVGIRIVGGRDHQYLVTSNAAMPVSQSSELVGVEIHCLRDAINDHKVISRTVHFGEGQLHAMFPPGITSRSHSASSVSRWPITWARSPVTSISAGRVRLL